MKIIIILLLSISFQVFAKSDSENKSNSQCGFFNNITMEGCRSLSNSLFGKPNEMSAESGQLVSKCFVVTISEFINSGNAFAAKWGKMSVAEKKLLVESRGNNFKATTSKKHKLDVDDYMKKCTKKYQQSTNTTSPKETVTNLSFSEFKKMTALGMPAGKIYSVYGRFHKRGGYICEDNEHTRTYDCDTSGSIDVNDGLLSTAKKSELYDLRGKYLCFYTKAEGEYITINDFKLGQCKN